MKKLVVLIFIVIGLYSCDNDSKNLIDNSDLIGKWSWQSTTGGISGDINITPETVSKSYTLHLKADYTYTILENETTVSSGTYSLNMENSIYSNKSKKFITYSDKNILTQGMVISGIIHLNDEILTISDNFTDGLASVFSSLN